MKITSRISFNFEYVIFQEIIIEISENKYTSSIRKVQGHKTSTAVFRNLFPSIVIIIESKPVLYIKSKFVLSTPVTII